MLTHTVTRSKCCEVYMHAYAGVQGRSLSVRRFLGHAREEGREGASRTARAKRRVGGGGGVACVVGLSDVVA